MHIAKNPAPPGANVGQGRANPTAEKHAARPYVMHDRPDAHGQRRNELECPDMTLLKRGARGPWVRTLQTFLTGQHVYRGEVDGKFGPLTEQAVRAYQSTVGLEPTGIVAEATWGAALNNGLQAWHWPLKAVQKFGPGWPTPPKGLRPLGHAGRERVFGHIAYRAAPTEGNPERVRIINAWQSKNLTRVTVPQLRNVDGAPSNGRVFVHRLAAEPLRVLFAAWEEEGLLDLVHTWAGSWAPRFVRGSRRTLSNHAYGTAFDINAAWNGLGARPAKVGATGSVRELVPTANSLGWFWGGHYKKRPDGMHMELVNLEAYKRFR